MKTQHAVRFNTNSDGIILSYSVIPYMGSTAEMQAGGHGADMHGFDSAHAAEYKANSVVGLPVAEVQEYIDAHEASLIEPAPEGQEPLGTDSEAGDPAGDQKSRDSRGKFVKKNPAQVGPQAEDGTGKPA